MCKSASSLVFWYTRQLVSGKFAETAQDELREATAEERLPGINEFVNPLTREGIDFLLSVSGPNKPVVVKCHMPLMPYLRELIESGEAKMAFSFRDPRDMILSAMDHHQRCIRENRRQAFAGFSDMSSSIEAAQWWCTMASVWAESELPLLIRYQNAVSNPKQQIIRIAEFLDIDVTEQEADQLIAKEQSLRSAGRNQFNTGSLIRYPSEMSAEDLHRCNESLGKYISRLGYPIDSSYLIKPRVALRPLKRFKSYFRRLAG